MPRKLIECEVHTDSYKKLSTGSSKSRFRSRFKIKLRVSLRLSLGASLTLLNEE